MLIGEPGVGKTAIVEGPGPADRARRRARDAQGEARRRAGPWGAHRRREVPRRVRGAPEGRAQGDQGQRGAGHPLHRRAPHGGRRGGRRGRHGRQQPPQAHARPRRAPHDRRDDARRVPQAHREGRGAGAALPARGRGPADRGGDDLHPARPARALRGAPRRPHHGLRARRRRHALQPLHHRALPPRQGDRPGRRGGQPPPDGDRLDAGRARRAGAAADPAGDRAGGAAQGEGRGLQGAPGDPGGRAGRDRRAGRRDEAALGSREAGDLRPPQTKSALEALAVRIDQAEREADYGTAAELKYGTLVQLQERLRAQEAAMAAPRADHAFSRKRWTRTTSPRSSAPGLGSR